MSKNVIIRKYQLKDAQECSALMQNHFRNYATNLSEIARKRIVEVRTTEYVRSISEDRIIVVAELKDKIVGMGALKGNEIRHMYVDRTVQKKDIGSTILNFLEEEAKNLGLSSIFVNSVFYATGFYLKNGFKIIRKTQIDRHGSIIDAVLLEKQLK